MSSAITVILLLGFPPSALARSQDVNQYAHSAWTARAGAFKGYPTSIAQTRDGYLWLGTEFGMLRFDGVRFVSWQPPAGTPLPTNTIVTLLAARDGSLWIGTTRGLARWKDGRLSVFTDLAGPSVIVALAEDRDGTVWAGTHGGTQKGTLCAVQDVRIQCDGGDGSFGRGVTSLFQDSRGNLWVGADTGLWRWKPGAREFFPWHQSGSEPHSIVEDDSGKILVALNREVRQVAGAKLEGYVVPDVSPAFRPTSLLRDRDGGLWIGTQTQGLLHVHDGRSDRFSRADGLSGDFVVDLFEDREGNVWVATPNGIDRFRQTSVTTYSTRQGLSADAIVTLLATKDGSVWLRTIGGLNRWKDGQITQYAAPPGLSNNTSAVLDDQERVWISLSGGRFPFEDHKATSAFAPGRGYVYAFAQDHEKHLWLSEKDRGLVRVDRQKIVELLPWSKFNGKAARTLIADSVNGGLWLGFFGGGIAYLKDGTLRASYTAAQGLGHGDVTSLLLQDGALWAATQGGLSRVMDGRVTTLTSKNGLPCEAIQWVIEDDARAFWLRTSCGLVRIDRSEIEAWSRDSTRRVALTTYDESDGFPSHSDLSVYSPQVTKAADGRLWFATYGGAAVIDPQHIPFNRIPPPVHIEEVTADRKSYHARPALRLPPLVRDLRIDYTAISLVAPQKVRFRYRLEGREQEWVDAGDRRQAFYTDLPPGHYRFRVVASNNDGIWNEDGAAWEFSIEPAFYQTNEFRIALALVLIGTLWLLYSVRLRRLAAQMNASFEQRLAERTRIAQDLHDTLLQGSISAAMQLHVLADNVADQGTKLKLDRILQRFRQSIDEGRQTVQTLRTTPAVADDLERALARDAEDLRGDQTVDIKVLVEGRRQPLHPLIRDECYRIGREALANAFRHAQPTRVVIELSYAGDRLRLRIRDNGRGIDRPVLEAGRPGHWGIKGMRERADHIRATLKLHSNGKNGTEMELLVPAAFAFQSTQSRGRSKRGWPLVDFARRVAARWREPASLIRDSLAKISPRRS